MKWQIIQTTTVVGELYSLQLAPDRADLIYESVIAVSASTPQSRSMLHCSSYPRTFCIAHLSVCDTLLLAFALTVVVKHPLARAFTRHPVQSGLLANLSNRP